MSENVNPLFGRKNELRGGKAMITRGTDDKGMKLMMYSWLFQKPRLRINRCGERVIK